MSPQTLRRFLQLSRQQKRIVLVAAGTLLATRIGLRIFGFRTYWRFLGSFGRGPAEKFASGESIGKARAIATLQSSAERHLFFLPNCLERSLVLQWMLRREGIAANMRIGGRKQGARFEAHAWVEVNGTPVENASSDGTAFVPFDSVHSALETEIP